MSSKWLWFIQDPSSSSKPPKEKKGNAYQDAKKISAEEVQYKHNHGQCFKHGEKFGAGHQYKLGHLNFLLCYKEDDGEFMDAIGDQDEHMDRT